MEISRVNYDSSINFSIARNMKTFLRLYSLFLVFAVCNFSRSVKKDFISGVYSAGSNISCKEVYLTVNGIRTQRNSFIYGETFVLNFSDVTGFTKENGNVFPGMIMTVINPSGDTLMQTDDLISGYPTGMNYSPLVLTADLTVAAPIKSGGEYTVIINIRDRKGTGTYKSTFDFKVIKNDKIPVESSKVTYDEIYIYSQGKDKVITDNKIKFNDNIYIIIEGLKGFRETGGMVFPGLKFKAADSEGNILIGNDDLFTDYDTSGVASADLAQRVSAHFRIPGTQFNNPLHCELTVWDKKSDARVIVLADMVAE
jgi:hypothetical protein